VLVDDEIVVAVPLRHRWARAARVSATELLATPLVLRDPRSNARATIDTVLAERGLELAPAAAELATPLAAMQEARRLGAPVMLSRHILGRDLNLQIVEVDDLRFPRAYLEILPAAGEPASAAQLVLDRLRARAAGPGAG
jgi:hypothetical protein